MERQYQCIGTFEIHKRDISASKLGISFQADIKYLSCERINTTKNILLIHKMCVLVNAQGTHTYFN